MPPLAITAVFVGLFALALVPLTGMVGYRRAQKNIHFLHGGDETLLRLMRAHGNFTETVPMALLAMAAAEWTGTPAWALWTAGIALLAGRAIHAWSVATVGWSNARGYGMLLTLFALGWFGTWALARGLARLWS